MQTPLRSHVRGSTTSKRKLGWHKGLPLLREKSKEKKQKLILFILREDLGTHTKVIILHNLLLVSVNLEDSKAGPMDKQKVC